MSHPREEKVKKPYVGGCVDAIGKYNRMFKSEEPGEGEGRTKDTGVSTGRD